MKLERKQVSLNPIKSGDTNTYDLTYDLKIFEVLKSSDGFNQFQSRKDKKHSFEHE